MSKMGLSLLDNVLYTPTLPECLTQKDCHSCPVAPCAKSVQTFEAVRLVQAGARTPLICQLTGLSKKFIRRLYLQLHGRPPPSGSAPFSDAWFRESERRMLHASTVWRINSLVKPIGRSKARALLDVYDLYQSCFNKPLLNLTRIESVFLLVRTFVWKPRQCVYCNKFYLTPVDEELGDSCPGCRLYHRFRCSQCKAPLTIHVIGRPRTICNHGTSQDSNK